MANNPAVPSAVPPHYEHDCNTCVFLGTYTNPDTSDKFDLYYHPVDAHSFGETIIARYGIEGDYISGLTLVGFDRTLTVAYRRAHDQGLVEKSVSEFLDQRPSKASRTYDGTE